MENLEIQATLDIEHRTGFSKQTLEKTNGAISNGESGDTGNIRHRTQNML
jgi:hypothetical protein